MGEPVRLIGDRNHPPYGFSKRIFPLKPHPLPGRYLKRAGCAAFQLDSHAGRASMPAPACRNKSMRAYHCLIVAILASLAATATSPAQSQQPRQHFEPPKLVTSRQTSFAIPFTAPTGQDGTQTAREVQLYVSGDGGRQWRLEARSAPTDRRFRYTAPRDGEYWFAVRTIDAQGRPWPDGVMQPGLHVLVDTTKPWLHLTAKNASGGEVEVSWHVEDTHLEPESLKLHYQVTGSGPWQPIPAPTSQHSANRTTAGGSARFRPVASSGSVAVRAEVVDRAGNKTLAQQLVSLQPSEPQGSLADGSSTNPGQAAPNAAGAQRVNPSSQFPGQGGGTGQWPADQTSRVPFEQTLGGNATGLSPPPRQYNQETTGANPSWPTTYPSTTAQPAPATPLPVQPPVARNAATSSFGDAGRPRETASLIPPDIQPYQVRSTRFELDYDVNRPAELLERVELWMTRDGGQTWVYFGADDDRRSPLVVHVPQEGVYGFVVVPIGRGSRAAAPERGRRPEIWVSVDGTPPYVRFLEAEPAATAANPTSGPAEITIRWEARDALPLARPVALYWSQQPQGPWQEIAAEVENSGQFTWRPGGHVPDPVYLKVVVRDQAGNTSEATSPAAVPLRVAPPAAHIRGVRAIRE